MEEALFATGIPFMGRGDEAEDPAYAAGLMRVARASSGVRRYGSAALDMAWVAAGRYDGFWEFGLSPWDMAAGVLLVTEAGGLVGDLKGGLKHMETGDIACAPPKLFKPIMQTIRSHTIKK